MYDPSLSNRTFTGSLRLNNATGRNHCCPSRWGRMMDLHAITHNLGGYWRNGRGQAPCPICQPELRRDQSALSLSQKEGRVLLHCFKSGCTFSELAKALQLPELGTMHSRYRELGPKPICAVAG